LDIFGHSSSMAALSSKFGYDVEFLSRIDFRDR